MTKTEEDDGIEEYFLIRVNSEEQKEALKRVVVEGEADLMKQRDYESPSKGQGSKKDTWWTEIGAGHYDEKKAEKSGLGTPSTNAGRQG